MMGKFLPDSGRSSFSIATGKCLVSKADPVVSLAVIGEISKGAYNFLLYF